MDDILSLNRPVVGIYAKKQRLKSLLHLVWVIYSAGFGERYDMGKKYLEECRELFENIRRVDELKPDIVWHYYNNRACYIEWDYQIRKGLCGVTRQQMADKLDEAAKLYLCCLNIPAIEKKWISGTYVNLCAIDRERASLVAEVDSRKKLLTMSVCYGEKGLDLKREIGDSDEFPVAAHNYALSMLYLLNDLEKNERDLEKNDREVKLKNVIKIVQEGLDVLDRCAGTKKRGQLLVESSEIPLISCHFPAMGSCLSKLNGGATDGPTGIDSAV